MTIRHIMRRATVGTAIFAVVAGSLAAVAPTHALAQPAAVRPSNDIALSVGTGMVVHELGHLVLLRGVPACVVVRGLRVSLLHRRLGPRREVGVALGGPGAGIALAAAALLAVELYPCVELAAVALVEAIQLLGLTTLTHDGRRVCAWS